jgi:hypothetical protein
MNYRISKIEPYLENSIQCLSITAEGYFRTLNLTHEALYKVLVPLDCKEFEHLVGGQLQVEYYEKGERMKNGRTSGSFGYHVKSYSIDLPKAIAELRLEKSTQVLNFETIYDIHIFTRKNRESVCIRTTFDKVCFMTLSNFQEVSSLTKDQFGLLTGSFISPVFYEKDEVSEETGWIVYQSGTIIKNLNLRCNFSFSENFADNGKQFFQESPRGSSKRPKSGSYDKYRPSYSKYNGYGGYDDQTIDNAFEGDVTATWGLD